MHKGGYRQTSLSKRTFFIPFLLRSFKTFEALLGGIGGAARASGLANMFLLRIEEKYNPVVKGKFLLYFLLQTRRPIIIVSCPEKGLAIQRIPRSNNRLGRRFFTPPKTKDRQ